MDAGAGQARYSFVSRACILGASAGAGCLLGKQDANTVGQPFFAPRYDSQRELSVEPIQSRSIPEHDAP
jgi:hypothetical protein